MRILQITDIFLIYGDENIVVSIIIHIHFCAFKWYQLQRWWSFLDCYSISIVVVLVIIICVKEIRSLTFGTCVSPKDDLQPDLLTWLGIHHLPFSLFNSVLLYVPLSFFLSHVDKDNVCIHHYSWLPLYFSMVPDKNSTIKWSVISWSNTSTFCVILVMNSWNKIRWYVSLNCRLMINTFCLPSVKLLMNHK